jgi:hypothetical protein
MESYRVNSDRYLLAFADELCIFACNLSFFIRIIGPWTIQKCNSSHLAVIEKNRYFLKYDILVY